MEGMYLVTDQAACIHHPLETVVAKAVDAGVSCVQLREKTIDTRSFLDRALALKNILAPARVPLIINDRLDIALAAGAHGVHIGQSDMPYAHARKLLGPKAIIGLSVETWEDVVEAQDLDVDYIGVSPVFSTPTKTDTKEPWELEGLERIKGYSRHPLVAIGGLNQGNIAPVIQAGARSIAVVSAICSAPDPFAATRALCACFQ
ncbi:thiamine-phosphate pyrophosphorylase [Desulfocicer vacuolatum DSM 3385]|uniref:Thiamine-phosphate synthase n=1 Tax=Desulfocicer vacuolatum DSM 3385 TaxID=1121400 RepID=A0A1W2E908_9BACT|nr:thiamine phosphate synthase [Desulfocicer vacuolatum]SMD05786.1 thiamine-phosphate pyrophosphorylase [Desulfocicer vacuolatum DSM 3385]